MTRRHVLDARGRRVHLYPTYFDLGNGARAGRFYSPAQVQRVFGPSNAETAAAFDYFGMNPGNEEAQQRMREMLAAMATHSK